MSSPYTNPVTTITDISKYFEKDETKFSMKFIGETLELRIPRRFGTHGFLEIGDSVTTIGSMDMIFDGKYRAGLNILAAITIEPTDIGSMTYNGVEYVVLHLKTGDIFMTSYRVIQNQRVVYALWKEYIESGNVPYHYTYNDLLKLFDTAKEITGAGIGVSRSVWSGIIAHLARDSDSVTVPYRRTPMDKPMMFVPLNSISLAPSGTVARINGSYFRDRGTVSALLHEVTEKQPFEDVLRGLPPRDVGKGHEPIL
jgi:hypothetical protein